MEQNDAELIQRILQGDQDALDPLVRKYQKGVHALVWRKIGDFHIAQEITQDAFLNAYRKLRTLKNPNQFAGGLYVIAANLSRDWLRRKRLPMESLDTEDANNTSEVDKVSYSKYLAEKQETDADETRREIVKELLQKLPESERTVMTLHYLGEMTIKAISEFLGVSQNTVKSRLSRARNRLRKEEDVIQQHLGSFQLPEQLTENILREAARITPVAPTSSKRTLPWMISAASSVLIFIFAGVGTQYLSRFQKPYDLSATSEPTVQIIDAVFIYDSPAKPNIRNQPGGSIVPGKGLGVGQKPEESLVATLPIDTNQVSVPSPQWTQTKGPVGGGVQNLFAAADGQLYAGTGTDLYRLANNNSVWSLVSADMPINGTWQLREHEDNLYIVSDAEVLISVDRGVTWEVLGTRPMGELIDLVITDGAFYLGLTEGVFRSVDVGKSWAALNDGGLTGKKIHAITAIENSVFVGTDSGLYRLNAEGWKRLPVGEVENIRALASSGNRIYAAVGKAVKKQNISTSLSMSISFNETSLSLYRSTDLGDSWQALDFVERDDSDDSKFIFNVGPVDSQTKATSDIKMVAVQESLFVLSGANSYYSDDAGETWTPLDSSAKNIRDATALVSVNANTFYKSGGTGIYRTTDAGKTWHAFSTGLVKTTVFNLVSLHDVLYANTGHILVASSDGGESWNRVSDTSGFLSGVWKFGDVLYAKRVERSYPEFFHLSAEAGGLTLVPGMPILETSDYGKLVDEEFKNAFPATVQDESQNAAGEAKKPDLADFDIDRFKADAVDGLGESIAKIIQAFFGSFAVSGDTYYMEYEQRLFRWKLGTTEWVDTGLVDEGGFMGSLDALEDINDPNVIQFKLAVSGTTVYVGKRDGTLFQSFDEGDTWNDVTTEPPFPFASFNAVAFAGSTVYVATDKGVAFSSDGVHWRPAITDTEGTPIVIEKFVVDGTTLYGTSEQRVYQLSENADMWRQVTPEIPVPVTDLAVDGSVLYVGTRGQGVFRFKLD